MLKLAKSYLLHLLKSKTDRLLHYFRSQEFILDVDYDDGCKGYKVQRYKDDGCKGYTHYICETFARHKHPSPRNPLPILSAVWAGVLVMSVAETRPSLLCLCVCLFVYQWLRQARLSLLCSSCLCKQQGSIWFRRLVIRRILFPLYKL